MPAMVLQAFGQRLRLDLAVLPSAARSGEQSRDTRTEEQDRCRLGDVARRARESRVDADVGGVIIRVLTLGYPDSVLNLRVRVGGPGNRQRGQRCKLEWDDHRTPT